MTVLPRPAPPNRPALPPRTNGVSRSMTLMPVSKISVLVVRSVSGGSIAVDRPVGVGMHRAAAVDRIAEQIEHAAERRLADRHRDGRAGIDALLAADHAVGAAQGDAADAAAAEMLLHLAGQIEIHALVVGFDLHGVVDRRQAVFGKLDVERRADDLRHAADAFVRGCPGWEFVFVAVAMICRLSVVSCRLSACRLSVAELPLSVHPSAFILIPSAPRRRRALP